jgi:hypothetical protein
VWNKNEMKAKKNGIDTVKKKKKKKKGTKKKRKAQNLENNQCLVFDIDIFVRNPGSIELG